MGSSQVKNTRVKWIVTVALATMSISVIAAFLFFFAKKYELAGISAFIYILLAGVLFVFRKRLGIVQEAS